MLVVESSIGPDCIQGAADSIRERGRCGAMTLQSALKRRSKASITVRRANTGELPRVRRAFLKVLNEIPYYNSLAKRDEARKYTVKKLEEKTNEDRDSIICALNEKGAIVGYLFNHFDDYTIWIDWFGVPKDKRRLGIGTLLLEYLFQSARQRNCHKIWCDTRASNIPSMITLKKAGFSSITEIKNHWYGQDFILWERLI